MTESTMKPTVYLFAGLVLLAACSSEPTAADNASASLLKDVPSVTDPAVLKDIVALRQAMAANHRFEVGTAEGAWSVQFPPGCFTSAVGAMGYHYHNAANDGVLDVTRPQLIIYEPEKNGQKRLVAVEFFSAAPESGPAPVLFGQAFHFNSVFQLWVLHVWAFKENPRGIFQDWNPQVSCQYASEAPVVFSRSHH
jgi:hypothetical protein